MPDGNSNQGLPMAVAVKNMPETTLSPPRPMMDRLPVHSLLGAGYVLAGIAVIFYALPALWWDWLHWPQTAVTGALLILAMVVAAGVWAFGAIRLGGAQMPAGARAGTFFGILEFVVIGLVTCGIGNWIEASTFGQSQPMLGLGVTVLIGLALLAVAVRYYFHPAFKRWLVMFEEQGWFSVAAYKKEQGKRVRRGTILGVLALVGCGVYTMLAHRLLESGPPNWQVTIPFSGGRAWVILPDARFTVPILIAAAAIWIAYRVANFPGFADFLIATEAELNKVSWSPWKKLKQDTVVVLITVLLLTLFLFFVDQGWAWLLTRVGVVQVPPAGEVSDSQKEVPW
jgi:preprotein translocase SecE subunit